MVDDRAVDRFDGAGQAAGRAAVAVAGGRIAAWVIMGKNDSGAVVKSSIGNDCAERKIGSVLIAWMAGQMKAIGLIVEMGNPQAFARWIGVGEAARKEGSSGGRAVQFQRKFGTLISHCKTVGERDGGSDLNRVEIG